MTDYPAQLLWCRLGLQLGNITPSGDTIIVQCLYDEPDFLLPHSLAPVTDESPSGWIRHCPFSLNGAVGGFLAMSSARREALKGASGNASITAAGISRIVK